MSECRKMPLILASSSPRRRDLLTEAGVCFEVVPPSVDEPTWLSPRARAAQQAEALAYFKARSVADATPRRRILGADTVVSLAGEVLGKPADADDARRMLRKLSGTRHEVITGVAIVDEAGQRWIRSDVTYITMATMTDEDVEQYVASGEWEGKAGAYAIQETADRYVRQVEGSFTNVVGLPVELVSSMLDRLAARPPDGPDSHCRDNTHNPPAEDDDD